MKKATPIPLAFGGRIKTNQIGAEINTAFWFVSGVCACGWFPVAITSLSLFYRSMPCLTQVDRSRAQTLPQGFRQVQRRWA